MRTYLQRAPWWVLSGVQGTFFALAMTVWRHLSKGESWVDSFVPSAISGLLFGAFMGPQMVRQRTRQQAAAGPVSEEHRREVARASWRGAVPADAQLRAAALRLAEHQAGESDRHRTGSFAVFGSLLVLGLVLAVTDSLWWLLTVAVHALLLANTVWWPRRLKRRAALLRQSSA